MWMVMIEIILWLIGSDSVKYGLTGIFQEWNLMKDQIWLKSRMNYLVINKILCLCSTTKIRLIPAWISIIVA